MLHGTCFLAERPLPSALLAVEARDLSGALRTFRASVRCLTKMYQRSVYRFAAKRESSSRESS